MTRPDIEQRLTERAQEGDDYLSPTALWLQPEDVALLREAAEEIRRLRASELDLIERMGAVADRLQAAEQEAVALSAACRALKLRADTEAGARRLNDTEIRRLREAHATLAAFARTAPGRLPSAVQDALDVARATLHPTEPHE